MKVFNQVNLCKSDESQGSGVIFDVQSYAIHDGPGVRTLVFEKGCPLKCWWCHNPESRSPGFELMYFDSECKDTLNCVNACPENAITISEELHINRDKCTACGICAKECPTSSLKIIGQRITSDELLEKIVKYNHLYGGPEGGVTFSGGEPMFQPRFLKEMLVKCKANYIHTAVETSGYTSRETLESIMPYVDLFLYDLKVFRNDESINYTGMPSDLIKENLKFLLSRGKEVMLRMPVIPGITDSATNIAGWVDFLTELKGLKEIDLLPYHDVGEKFYRLGQEFRMTHHKAPSDEALGKIKREFEAIGLIVRIGG